MAQNKRVLIANRGEIAIRIARAAHGLGMESVSVYAAVDQLALHTRVTTETKLIGQPEDTVAAYLDIEVLIRVAKETNCDCVHPGYGFLSENSEFASRCAEEGLTFIGPPADVLSLFGDKVQARELALSLDIPIVAGSEEQLLSAKDAVVVARKIGYPIMLKASAGGGGRGMRIVESEDEIADAFERCRSEAAAAFGNSAIFIEKLVVSPRHIEVQIIADAEGNVVHLHERDCSVQLRHQKVIEIAPAFGLDEDLKNKMLNDAVRLVKAVSYLNAGTVEFLVCPETGEYYFIECNPRIQVEHTVTEQVTGVDLVETQFLLANGDSLKSLGMGTQFEIGPPRGFALQTRVVAQSTGTITAYKEPSGFGVRVDACGYAGYTPPPQFDPLLAKLVCSSGSRSSFLSVVDRTIEAIDGYQIAGVMTNLPQLKNILSNSKFRSGDARTSLLSESSELLSTNAATTERVSGQLALLEQQAGSLGMSLGASAKATTKAMNTLMPELSIADGDEGIECPMDSSVLEICVTEGDEVAAGANLFVVTAMKMETAVVAPRSGTVKSIQRLKVGDTVPGGQVMLVLTVSERSEQKVAVDLSSDQTWGPMLAEVNTLRRLAIERLAPDSKDPGVIRQYSRDKLTCRDRILLLLDEGTFREVGSVAGFASYDEFGEIEAFTPANSIGGWGEVSKRTLIVCADDFTSRGGHADGAIAAKSGYLDRLSIEMRMPSIRMLDGSSGGGSVAAMVPAQKQEGESKAKESQGAITAGRPRVAGGGGSFLPGHLGSTMYTQQLSTVPVVNLLLGSVVGIGAAKAVLGHFSVMVRDVAQLFVAGPPVVSHAMGYDITKEELGGWHIHCTNGSVDNLAETEEEAVAMTKRFLSYLPSSVFEAPPIKKSDPSDPIDRWEDELFTIVSRKRVTTFDMRRAITLMADKDSFFEIGSLWGTDQIVGFVRFNGHPVGVIASDSRHVNGGALTANGCDKLKRHLDICDLFHIPVLNLIDNPGFAVGLEHEMAGTIRKGGEWMVAFAQVKVPIFTVMMRRSFGVAGNNYATPRAAASMRVAWPATDSGGIPPEGGIEAAYKRQLAEAEDPEALRAELYARIESARGPVGPLNKFQIEEMIDPRETRRYICEWVKMAYKIVSLPAGLVPRDLQFRP